MYRKHKDLLSVSVSTGQSSATMPSSSSVLSSDFAFDLSLPESVAHDVDCLLHRDNFEQKKKSMLFLMQLKEDRFLTQSAVSDVVSGCKEVFKHTLSHLRAGISSKLSEAGIDFW